MTRQDTDESEENARISKDGYLENNNRFVACVERDLPAGEERG